MEYIKQIFLKYSYKTSYQEIISGIFYRNLIAAWLKNNISINPRTQYIRTPSYTYVYINTNDVPLFYERKGLLITFQIFTLYGQWIFFTVNFHLSTS